MIVLLLALVPLAYRAVSSGEIPRAVSVAQLPGGEIGYLHDPQGAWTPAGMENGRADAAFKPLPRPGAGPRGSYWLRLKVPNPALHAASVTLEFADPYLNRVTAHGAPFPAAGSAAVRTGQAVPLAERSVRSHLPALNVLLPPAQETTIHLHVEGRIERPSDVLLWPAAEEFRRYEQRQVLTVCLYLGLWGALLVYNAFVYTVLRDRVVLLYVGYLAAVGGLALVGTNFSVYFFDGPSGMVREVSIFFLLLLGCGLLVQFSRAFLATAQISPRLDRALRGLAGLNFAGLLSTPALFNLAVMDRGAQFLYLLAVLTLLVLPVAGVYLWTRRCRQASLYVLAFACFGLGLAWMILAQLRLVPPDNTNGGPFLLGSALELLFLAIAVAGRYRLIREEKEQLQATYTARLETDVAARTGELSAANADKDRLISIIAHDVRAPLTSLLVVSRSLAREPARRPSAEIAAEAEAIRQRSGELLVLVDNLLDWGRLRTGHLTRDPADFNLAGLAGAALPPGQAAAAAKGLRLVPDLPPELEIHADGHAVQCILRNLVSNAVKFTRAGTVSVSAAAVGPFVEVRVRDSGVGIPAERLAQLNRPAAARSETGTAGEGGIGIGLALCRELAEREGGTLRLESPADANLLAPGTVAIVTFPAAR